MVSHVEKATDGIGVRLRRYSNETDEDAEVNVADAQVMIVGGPQQKNDPERIATAMTVLLQQQIDVRKRRDDRAEFSADDPVILSDPATPRVFWDGDDVVERPAIVTVAWDGTAYVPTIRGLG